MAEPSVEFHQSQRTSDWWWRAVAEDAVRIRIVADSSEGYRRHIDAVHGAELTLAALLRSPDIDVARVLAEFMMTIAEYGVGRDGVESRFEFTGNPLTGFTITRDGTQVVTPDGQPVVAPSLDEARAIITRV